MVSNSCYCGCLDLKRRGCRSCTMLSEEPCQDQVNPSRTPQAVESSRLCPGLLHRRCAQRGTMPGSGDHLRMPHAAESTRICPGLSWAVASAPCSTRTHAMSRLQMTTFRCPMQQSPPAFILGCCIGAVLDKELCTSPDNPVRTPHAAESAHVPPGPPHQCRA